MTRKRSCLGAASVALLLVMPLSARAQSLPDQALEGAVLPQNLNALGGVIMDRVGDMIREETDTADVEGAQGQLLDLFTGSEDEDPNLAEIRRIAKSLETQRSVILKLADLQFDPIDFGMKDPHAAFQSRIPARICELAIPLEFCRNLRASFR